MAAYVAQILPLHCATENYQPVLPFKICYSNFTIQFGRDEKRSINECQQRRLVESLPLCLMLVGSGMLSSTRPG